MKTSTRISTALLALILFTAGCGSTQADNATEPSIRRVSAVQGLEIQTDPPTGLVVLDVRTPEEFQSGHLKGAIMIDFYEADFADQLAELDPDVPYLLYCRSGNRSGQALEIMRGLGFADVADVEGGIVSWSEAGLPVVQP